VVCAAERKKAAVAAAGGGVKGVDAREGRITGKQWFMQQLAAGETHGGRCRRRGWRGGGWGGVGRGMC